MKRIEHKVFLKNNQLDKGLLLEPIQEKIEIFDRMHKLLDTVTDCEKGHLLDQLEELDLEILEDIDEEYADKLEFNEIEEVLEEQPNLETVTLKKETSKPANDEAILEELVRMGRVRNIAGSTFRDLDVKTQLGWNTVIGKYRVIRTSVFRYRYEVKNN